MCWRVSIRRTRRRTPVACADRSSRSILPRSSQLLERRRRPSRRCCSACSTRSRASACHPLICPRKRTTETSHEQEDARPLRPQVEPVRPRRAGRGVARQPPIRVLLLARRAARRRRRLRPRHRSARDRQVRHPAHPRRSPRSQARRQGRHRQPAAVGPLRRKDLSP